MCVQAQLPHVTSSVHMHTQEPQQEVVLELHAVRCDRRVQGKMRPIFIDVSFDVKAQEVVAVIGPSGCGKSTLLHMVGGVLSPQQGTIKMRGEVIEGQRGKMSYMPQQDCLLPWRTVLENILLPAQWGALSSTSMHTKATSFFSRIFPKKQEDTVRLRALAWLERVGLTEYAHVLPEQLSGGMRQRIAFLRALQGGAPLMGLDEPFGALDALTRVHMQQWVLELQREEQRTILMITHSIEEALLLADRIVVLGGVPATKVTEVRNPLPFPRHIEQQQDQAFLYAKKHLGALLQPQRKAQNIF